MTDGKEQWRQPHTGSVVADTTFPHLGFARASHVANPDVGVPEKQILLGKRQ